MRNAFLYGLAASLLLASSCVIKNEDGDDDDVEGGRAGESSTGGRATSGGRTGDGGDPSDAGSSGEGGTATGEGGASAGAGGALEGGAGAGGTGTEPAPTDCADAEALPSGIVEDLAVGPGCVKVNRTTVSGGAKLTIAPGTTIQFAPAGYLAIEGGAISALGTAREPIVFTSESSSPAAGDWQCVFLDGSSSDAEFRNAIFEYGGDDCDANGAGHEGMLTIGSAARAVSDNVFRHSIAHAVKILPDGNVREFEGNRFTENEAASINVAAPQLLQLGEGLTFDDDDDFILVDTTFGLDASGTWLGQPVPFHLVGKFDIHDQAEVTLGAGLNLQLDGSSFEVFNANMIVSGTEAAPVVFSSSFANPAAGDWGCIIFSSPTGTPRFDHAVIEYAGNGQGCSGASHEGALVVPPSAVIRNTTFKEVAGFAIKSSECDTDWCSNTFESVEVGPLSCDSPATPTACP